MILSSVPLIDTTKLYPSLLKETSEEFISFNISLSISPATVL